MPIQPSRTPIDPDDPKLDRRAPRSGRLDDADAAPAEERHLANRTHREADGDDDHEKPALSGDDLVELDLDDLKDMEGPDA